jgi:hypothetical protein
MLFKYLIMFCATMFLNLVVHCAATFISLSHCATESYFGRALRHGIVILEPSIDGQAGHVKLGTRMGHAWA